MVEIGDEVVQIQDNARENDLISRYKLIANPKRLGYDAYDENGNEFELKSTTSGDVGTGRDVSLEMIENWRQRYWIIGVGRNLSSGFEYDVIYFLSPSLIHDGFNIIEAKITKYLNLKDEVCKELEGKMSAEIIERVSYIMSRGSTLNNPKISKLYIRKFGIEITDYSPSELRELIKEHS